MSQALQVATDEAVRVERLSVAFPQRERLHVALQGVNLELKRGELLCVVGASGSGKSTLLNVVAGLERPSSGSVVVRGRVALMFQEAALLPWLTAAGNVELALTLRGIHRSERKRIAHELLRRVHLAGFEGRLPHQLSGGMKQRVALARVLAQEAEILLMDEPFAALDAITRDLLHEELEGLWQRSGLTVLFVTHNPREAVRLGDRVVVFTRHPGRVAREMSIDLPRPRSLDSPEVAAIAGRITQQLKHEMRDIG
ncbi:MAG TPA: ABC transporter ATP-binding protein [Candidatus Dormibacteraeota bacterium]|nr:ABC transporter ATP-binding protein [Candidatus Dormibacteraeota bacterium]